MIAGPEFIAALGGLPFLRCFQPQLLIPAVVAVRRMHGERLGAEDLPAREDIPRWLTPETAVATRPGARTVESLPMPAMEQQQIEETLLALADAVPDWRRLLSLPVVYRLLLPQDRSLSASTYLWPQHVLLSRHGITTELGRAELVLHEMCHQWLYLIEELWPLDVEGARRVTLPSGTPDRAPREVIGAAHVAAATIRLHRSRAAGCTDGGRIALLAAYGQGCLELLDGLGSELTDTGHTVIRYLKEAL